MIRRVCRAGNSFHRTFTVSAPVRFRENMPANSPSEEPTGPSAQSELSERDAGTFGVKPGRFHPRVKTLISQLDRIAPRFCMKSGEVDILNDPKQFYDYLKLRISQAEKRIFLASLYIGKSQEELIEHLISALRNKPDLRLYILTDALRGTREAPRKCSASLLATLTKEFGNRVDIRMYHTPHLSGICKALVPRRFNEVYGLQHMKIYGFDDEVILSGANLSSDYFTNRQDRYYSFKSKQLTDYYYSIHKAISSISYKLVSSTKPRFKLYWPSANAISEPKLNVERFLSESTALLEPILRPDQGTMDKLELDESEVSTVVYPVSQLTPITKPDKSTEKPAILRILSLLDSRDTKWVFTAGYFNIYPEFKDRLLISRGGGKVITAAPEANGFYKSKGVSKYLPDAYLFLAKKFLESVKGRPSNCGNHIGVYEWKNGVVNTPGGWSYHAKGIWLYDPGDSKPGLTVIGSSNYTKRAYRHDLETNAVLITKDENLKTKMEQEVKHLLEHAEELKLSDFDKENRKIPPLVKVATGIVGNRL